MLTNNALRSSLLRTALQNACKMQSANVYSLTRIGNRDHVGFGVNGSATYEDRVDFPFPAIRYKENTPDVLALREKEKGDWKKLSLEEKKKLYRISFRQTFAEVNAPTGEWKSVFGIAIALSSLSIWIYMGLKMWVLQPIPETCAEDRRQAQLRRMLDLGVGKIDGLSSKFDYEKDEFKK